MTGLSETIYELILFYAFHFHDWFTTVLDLKLTRDPGREQNPLVRPFANSPLKLALYKFSLCNVIPILSLFVLHSLLLVWIDTLVEAVVTINNMIALYRHKRQLVFLLVKEFLPSDGATA